MVLRVLAFWGALLIALPAAGPGQAGQVRLDGEFVQGGFVVGQAPPGSAAALDGRNLRVSADGVFAFGFGRDAGAGATLVVTLPDGREDVRELVVADREFDIQRIDGLPPEKVTPPPEVLIWCWPTLLVVCTTSPT